MARRVLSFLFLLSLFVAPTFAAGWVSPNGYSDPNSKWTTEPRAYDGNTATYASDNSNVRKKYGRYLYLTLSSAIKCNRIRINADYDTSYVSSIDIDVYRDGAWVDVYEGAINNAAWDEIGFDSGQVTQARVRYYYKSTIIFWVYEFEFYEEADVINVPTVATTAATSVEETTAILHGCITDDGGDPCQWRFQYGTTTSYGTNTDWTGSRVSGEDFSKLITGLSSGQTYHIRAQVQNSAGIASGADMTFTTGSPGTGWVSPTGMSDPDGMWEDEVNSYDDDTVSYAKSYHNINETQWSSYVYFSHSSMNCDGVRFFARGPTSDTYYIDRVDVDVYRDGAWVDVYEGSFSHKEWIEKSFTEGTVTQARIRFRVNSTSAGLYYELYELDFHRVVGINITGTCDGSTPVSLLVNGVSRGIYSGASPYSFSTTVGTGDVITVFYNNNVSGTDGAVVTTASDSDLTLDLAANNLVLRSDGGALTNADLASAHNGDTDLPYTVSGNDVTLDGGVVLTVAYGQSYCLGGDDLTLPANFVNNGTFIHAGGTVTFSGTTVISGSGSMTFGGVTINGTLTAPSCTFGVDGNFVNNGTFNHNSGTVAFDGTTAVSGSSTTTFNNITVNGSLAAPAGTMNVAGNFTNNGTFVHNSGTVSFIGTTNLGGSDSFAFNNISVTGSLVAPSGTMSVAGNFAKFGTFTHNSGTVLFTGSSASIVSGSNSFYNLSCVTPGKQINFTAGTTQTISGVLDLTGSGASMVLLRSTATGSKWNITLSGGAQSISYVDVQDSNAYTNTITVAGGVNSGNNNTNWIFASTRYWVGGTGNWSDTAHWSGTSGGAGGASVPTSANLVIFNSSSGGGTCTVNQVASVGGLKLDTGNSTTLSLGANSIAAGATGLEIKSGSFSGGTGSLDVNGDLILSGGTFTAPGGSLFLSGNFNQSGGTFSHNLGTVVFDGTTAMPGSVATVFGNVTVSGSFTPRAAISIARNLVNNGMFAHNSGTVTFIGTTAVSGSSVTAFANVVISGSLTAPASMEVAGNFTNNGTFTHNSGTVDFNGTTFILGSSSTVFGGVTVDGSLVAPSGTMGVAGDFTNNGTFSHNGGTLSFTGTTTVGGSAQTTFNNVTVGGSLTSTGGTLQIAGNLTNNGTFTHNSGSVVFNGTTSLGGSSTTMLNNITIWGTLSAPSSAMNFAGGWVNDGTFSHNSGTVVASGSGAQPISGSHETVFYNFTVNGGGNAQVNGTVTVSAALSVASGSTLTVTSGDTLSLSAGQSVDGAVILDSGSILALASGIDFATTASGSFTAAGGSTVDRIGSGNYTLTLSGDVDLNGVSGNPVTFNYGALTLAGATGRSVSASYVHMNDVAASGKYLIITGEAWNNYAFDGWAFEDVAGTDEVTVRLETTGSVLMKNYETASGYLYGEDTDEDRLYGDTTCHVNWSPTAATVTGFTAEWCDLGIKVEWQTLCERRNAGFVIYRKELADYELKAPSFNAKKPDKGWAQLNRRLVLGADGSFTVQKYNYTDRTVRTGRRYAYALVDVDISGNCFSSAKPVIVGEYNPRGRGGMADFFARSVVGFKTAYEKKVREFKFGPELQCRENGFSINNRARRFPVVFDRKQKDKKDEDAGALARVVTAERGLYRVTSARLAELGFDLSREVELTNRGSSLPVWRVEREDGGFDLCFFADKYSSLYSEKNIYWLRQLKLCWREPVVNTGKVQRMRKLAGDYEALSRFEKNVSYRMSLPGAVEGEDHWFCASYLYGGRSANFTLNCSEVVDGKPASLAVMLRSYATTSPASHIKILVNGTEVGEYSWNGARRYLAEAVIPAGVLIDGDNIITLSSFGDTPAVMEADFIDWVQVKYRRRFSAQDGRLSFGLDDLYARGVNVTNLDTGNYIVVDVTDTLKPERILRQSFIDSGEDSELYFDGESGHSYEVAAYSALREPESVELSPPPLKLWALRCDYLIITTEALREAAKEFANYRRRLNLEVEVLTLREALDAGNYGIYDPMAIRNVTARSGARYLLLLGDMTYDYRGTYYDDVEYSLPAKFVAAQDWQCVSDYYYSTSRTADDRPLVAVGRIPTRSNDEALAVLAKVKARDKAVDYEQGMIVAADESQEQFRLSCESAAQYSAGDMSKVYVKDLGFAAARSKLLSSWNLGARVVYYSGHGSIYQWHASGLLTTSDVPNLAEQAAPPVVLQLDCMSSGVHMHAYSGYGSLAEALLLTEKRGASAVVGSVGFSAPKLQAKLGEVITRDLKAGSRLGIAFRDAQGTVVGSEEESDVIKTFILLGDPLTR